MEKIVLSREDLESLLTAAYVHGSAETENHLEENPEEDFKLNHKASDFIKKVTSNLKFT